MKRRGFTIIEVIIVLAIGGFILTLALITLPSLSRSQRDTSRKSDMQIFVTRLKEFQTNNNRGALPGSSDEKSTLDKGGVVTIAAGGDSAAAANSWSGFFRDYFDENFSDPDTGRYGLKIMNCSGSGSSTLCNNSELSSLNIGTIYVVVGATCGNDNRATRSANTRKAAVLYLLETNDTFCGEI